MSNRPAARVQAQTFLTQLLSCFVVWDDAMTAITYADGLERPVAMIIAMIEALSCTHRQLLQLTVTPPMQAMHRAALELMQSAMDALDAVAAGHGSAAVRDMSEQLTIFETELVRFAERAGLMDTS